MGGGDLNMKKSWHPLLLKNQERVWLEEKKALEEKKKLDQLRKEKEEERQLQELQRLQEEQTGKKRTEKLEWMYSTPAAGGSQNANDLEDYLLGKKRVDKILTADDNAKIGAAHKNFIAVQNANNARDVAAKIREDPLFAIKQQEQHAYQALMANPLRLREMQERNGIKPKDKKDKSDKKKRKEEKRRLKEEKEKRRLVGGREGSRDGDDRHHHHHRRWRRSASPYSSRSRSRSPPPPPRRYEEEPTTRRVDDRRRGRSYSRSRSPPRYRDQRSRHEDLRTSSRSEESDEYERNGRDGKRRRSASPRHNQSSEPYSKRTRRSSPPPPRHNPSNPNPNPNPNRNAPSTNKASEDRSARLAAMSTNAVSMSSERQERLAAMLEKEKRELEEEEKARAKSKGMGGFLSAESKKVYGGSGGLEERIRRGKGGMVVDGDD